MRLSITILCVILCCSCHNKSDLKRIAELEKENKELNIFINNRYWQRVAFEDSILKEPLDLGCGFYVFNAINNSDCDYIKLSNSYKSIISLIEYRSNYIDTLFYTDALIKKLDEPKYTNHIICSNYKNDCFNLNLKPIYTGWNYFYAKLVVVNHRTDIVRYFSLTDSFYVYK